MNNKSLSVGLIVVAILAIIGVGIGFNSTDGARGPQGPQGPKGEQGIAGKDGKDGKNGVDGKDAPIKLGAIPGPEIFSHVSFNEGFTRGGIVVATSSTASAYTLTTRELREGVGYISWNAGLNVTLTTMASTSQPLSGLRAGESFEVLFYSATTTAATTITFAAGTGVDLQENEGGVVVLNGLELARLTFLKKSNTDVIVLVETMQVGD